MSIEGKTKTHFFAKRILVIENFAIVLLKMKYTGWIAFGALPAALVISGIYRANTRPTVVSTVVCAIGID